MQRLPVLSIACTALLNPQSFLFILRRKRRRLAARRPARSQQQCGDEAKDWLVQIAGSLVGSDAG